MLAGVPFDVYTDHHGLRYFLSKLRLNVRQAAWATRIADFYFAIHYKPGSETIRADGLTRTKGDESAGSDDAMFRDGQLLAVVGEQVDTEEDVEMTEAIAEERMR